MKITIDTEEVKIRGIPLSLFLHVLALYLETEVTDSTAKEANHLGYNIKSPQGYSISREGTRLVDSILIGSKSKISAKPDAYYEDIAKEVRKVFPTGLKAGTTKAWRDSTALIADRLRTLEQVAGYTLPKEDVVRAAIDYVESFGGDYEFMQTLPYFIYKDTVSPGGYGEWKSQLLSTIENIQDNENNY